MSKSGTIPVQPVNNEEMLHLCSQSEKLVVSGLSHPEHYFSAAHEPRNFFFWSERRNAERGFLLNFSGLFLTDSLLEGSFFWFQSNPVSFTHFSMSICGYFILNNQIFIFLKKEFAFFFFQGFCFFLILLLFIVCNLKGYTQKINF